MKPFLQRGLVYATALASVLAYWLLIGMFEVASHMP